MDDDNIFDVDDLNKIRVLDNETSTKTAQLKEECKDFIDSKSRFSNFCCNFCRTIVLLKCWNLVEIRESHLSEIDDFQTIVGGFIDLMDNLSTEVEREKLKVWITYLVSC